MAGKKKDKDKNKKKEYVRGSNDDFEILREVVSENIGLKMKVMDKLRNYLANRNQTLFDIAKDGQNSQRKPNRSIDDIES